MSRQSKQNSEDPQNPQPQGNEHPDVRKGSEWYYEHAPYRLSSLMTDYLLQKDAIAYPNGCGEFYNGWSQAQNQHRSLRRLHPGASLPQAAPGLLDGSDKTACLLRLASRRSEVLWDEKRSSPTLLLPRIQDPLEIALPGSVAEATPAERAVIIAVAEQTIGQEASDAVIYHEYLHILTGLPSLQSTQRALRGTLFKGCIRTDHGCSRIWQLGNAHAIAPALGIRPGIRCGHAVGIGFTDEERKAMGTWLTSLNSGDPQVDGHTLYWNNLDGRLTMPVITQLLKTMGRDAHYIMAFLEGWRDAEAEEAEEVGEGSAHA